jgi:tetratricopeptide (TPR) repeat protein
MTPQARGQRRAESSCHASIREAAAEPCKTRCAPASHLAQRFTREPELILACLETSDGRAGHAATVLAAAESAMAACPTYADLPYFAAHAALQTGDLERAADLLHQALKLNPHYRDALILAARVAIDRHHPEDAFALLQQALAGGADYADVHVMLGDLWRQRGDPQAAREAYERALVLNATLTAARAALAELRAPEAAGGNDELPA